MKKNEIIIGDNKIIEILSDEVIINNPQDALDLMVESGTEGIVIHDHNLNDDFFDLSCGLAGEVLLKFTNYRVKLAVIGNFEKYPGKSLRDFIYESNRVGNFLFVDDIEEVKSAWNR
jgi:hypothetical protein